MSKHAHIKQFEIAVEPDVVRVMRRAREMIEEGWCQKKALLRFHDGRISRCSSQAIFDATLELMPANSIIEVAQKSESLFIKAIGCLSNNIPLWNDNGHRKKEDVLETFDKAIRIGLS